MNLYKIKVRYFGPKNSYKGAAGYVAKRNDEEVFDYIDKNLMHLDDNELVSLPEQIPSLESLGDTVIFTIPALIFLVWVSDTVSLITASIRKSKVRRHHNACQGLTGL